MPTKTSAGPNEVVRLEVLRLVPPLGGGQRAGAGAGGGAFALRASRFALRASRLRPTAHFSTSTLPLLLLLLPPRPSGFGRRRRRGGPAALWR
jgi:hypothetical protein